MSKNSNDRAIILIITDGKPADSKSDEEKIILLPYTEANRTHTISQKWNPQLFLESPFDEPLARKNMILARKDMIEPFSFSNGSNRSPVIIAEGQNILDAVLPTSSGHSDFLSEIQIDPAFDFNEERNNFNEERNSFNVADVLNSSVQNSRLSAFPTVKNEPVNSPTLPKSSSSFLSSFTSVPSTADISQICSTVISKSPIKLGKKRKGQYDQYKDNSGKIKLELINDDEERKRVEEKRYKNREAAAKSRQRKKEKTEQLENDVSKLRRQLDGVDKDLSRLRNLTRKLRAIQSEHEKICPHQRFLEYQ